MSKNTIKINFNIKNSVAKSIQSAVIKSLGETADAILGDIKDNQTMPFDTGTLQNASTFIDTSNLKRGSVSIVSSTPYARRLYYHPEYNFSKTNNKHAGGKWFEPYKGGRFAEEIFQKMLKRNGVG